MNKNEILLVDDKAARFQRQTPNNIEDYVTYASELPGFEIGRQYDFSQFSKYKLVILHNSILIDRGLVNDFPEFAKSSNSSFILFSGNYSIPNIIYNGKVLQIPVNLFYSQDLALKFQSLDGTDNEMLLHFLYGDNSELAIAHNWKLLHWSYPEGLPKDVAKELAKYKIFQEEREIKDIEDTRDDNRRSGNKKILVLQNNTLPNFRYDGERTYESKGLEIDNFLINSDDESEEYDAFISSFLDEYVFLGKHYNLIVLPVSFDSNNSLTSEGLRIACHIRLTPKWKHTRTPILFFSPDSLEDLMKFVPYPSIFATGNIILSNANHIDDMLNDISKATQHIEMTESQYMDFLHKVKIERPANFKTHHSIANEWTLMQWSNMIDWQDNKPIIDSAKFLQRLHIKYMLQVLNKVTEDFGKSDKVQKKIEGICGKNIMLIDDEYDKGWKSILEKVLTASGANLACFENFDSSLSRDDLVVRINQFIDAYPSKVDCYLIDLRLNDDDVEEKDSSLLTGHRISKHIHGINRGNQVVILTASNKVWNMRRELSDEYGARYYALKESPEMLLNHDQSRKLYQDFCEDIVKACQQSYISDFQLFVDEHSGINTYIDVLIDLLVLDKSVEKTALIPSMLLAEVAAIEKYVVDNFEIRSHFICHLGGTAIRSLNKKIQFYYGSTDSRNPIDLKFSTALTNSWKFAPSENNSTLTLIIDYLHNDLGITIPICKLFLAARKERNTHIAHNGGTITMNIENVKTIFNEIIKKIPW